MRVLVLLLALAGCDRVFGLGDPYEDAPGTGGSGDARPSDGVGMPADAPVDGDGTLPVPLLHYRFDGTYLEASGGAPATCTTSASSTCGFVPGKYGMALHLDGSSTGEITLPSLPQTFTVMAWVNLASSGPVLELAQQLPAPSSDAWSIDVGTAIQFNSSSSVGTAITSSPRPSETWTNVAVTYSGTQQTLFVDGIKSASTVAGTITYGVNRVLCVGCRLSQMPTTYFGGGVDDVYLFDHVLTQTEIGEVAGAAH